MKAARTTRNRWRGATLGLLASLLLAGCGAALPATSPTALPVPGAAVQPSPSAPAPAPKPAAALPKGVTRHLGVNDVRGLAFSHDGALWAATTGGLARWDLETDTYVQYTTADGLPSNYVTDLALAPAPQGGTGGALWLATSRGVSCFDPSTPLSAGGASWTTYTRADGLVNGSVHAIAVTPDGVVWGVDSERGLVRFAGETWEQVPGPDGQPVYGSLIVAPDGALWVKGQGGLARFDGQGWAVYPAVEGVQAVAVAPAPQDGTGGTVWLGASNGVVQFQPDGG